MTRSRLSLAGLFLGLGLLGSARAEDSAPKWYENLNFAGYAETYYQHALNSSSKDAALQLLQNRVFDSRQSQFTPGGGELILSTADEKSQISAKLDLLFGEKNAAGFNAVGTPAAYINVGQAWVSSGFGPLRLSLGKFAASLGTESWNTLQDANFSRGLLYASEPLFHVGLKADWSLPGAFTLGALIDNGQNPLMAPWADEAASSDKGCGASLAWAGVKNLGLKAAWYRNPTVLADNSILDQEYASALLGLSLTDWLGIDAEYLYLATPTGLSAIPWAVSHGLALYAKCSTPLEGLSINGRFEQLTKVDEVLVNDSYTLTLKLAAGNLNHLLEYRADASNQYIYPAGDGLGQLQQTLTYAAVYAF